MPFVFIARQKQVQQSQVALTDNHTETRDASLGKRKALPLEQVSEFQIQMLGHYLRQ